MKNKFLSLRFYPNQAKTSKKTGKVPVYAKLVYDRKKVETRLNSSFDLTPVELALWNDKLMRVDSKNLT
jgi:hypothetical protein